MSEEGKKGLSEFGVREKNLIKQVKGKYIFVL